MDRNKVLIITAGILGGLLLLAIGPGIAFYTDYLWYDDVGHSKFFMTRLTTQLILFFLGAGIFSLIAGINIFLARKLSPLRPLAITNDFLFNLRRQMDPVIRWVILGTIAAGALVFGTTAFPQWQEFLLYLNAQDFGVKDPQFSKDISFYIFSLPIWNFVFSWLFGTLIVCVLAVTAVYAYAGAIGPNQPEGGYLAPQPRTHISILLGLLLLLKAAGYQIGQWELLYSSRGVVTGASYTDVHAQVPAFQVLFWIAIISACLLFANFWIKRLFLPVVAVMLMATAAIVVGGAYPWFVQQFQVNPNEIEKEEPYAQRNIEATLQAYGLDNVQRIKYDPRTSLSHEELTDNITVLESVRLWDDLPLLTSIQQTQELRPYYHFSTIGVDRYDIEGKETQVLVSAREVKTSQLEERNKTWQNIHLAYTHGYASVIVRSNNADKNGNPQFIVKNLPPENLTDTPALDLAQPRIYFGQLTNQFVIVNTTLDEIDPPPITEEEQTPTENGDSSNTTPTDETSTEETSESATPDNEAPEETRTSDEEKSYRYDADAGIKLDSFLKKLAFTIKFQDPKFLLSNNIQPESRLLYNRDIITRIEKIAPFLILDSSPYMAIFDGRIQWIVDAYTSTDLYPYSEFMTPRGQIPRLNYIRNSVKVIVDAYTGKTTFYRMDQKNRDPLIEAWASTLPDMFTDIPLVEEGATPSRLQADFARLQSHFRYPQTLFRIQLDTYRKYHVKDPKALIRQDDEWQISERAADERGQELQETKLARSQYLQMKLPLQNGKEGDEEFVLFNSYTPKNKNNLISLLVARSAPQTYGELVNLVLPSNKQVNGPAQVEAQIRQEPEISRQITLLDQAGSRVSRGQIRVIPIAGSLLYVQSMYVQSTEKARPELKFVLASFNNEATMAPTLDQALLQLFGYSPLEGESNREDETETEPSEPTDNEQQETEETTPAVPSTPGSSKEITSLANEINTTYQEMQKALADGDLLRYATLEKELGILITRLAEISGKA